MCSSTPPASPPRSLWLIAAVADYKRFLSGGSSTDPISLLKLAGVDMSTPAPVDAALAMFGELVDELDALTH